MLIIHILIEDFTQHTYIYNLTRRRIRLDTNETCQRYLYKIRNTKLVLEKGGGRRQIYLEREKKGTRRSKSVSLTARERNSQVQIAHKGARNEREVKGERERKRDGGRETGRNERRRERKPRGRLPVCASSCSCRQAGGVTTAQFVHSACGAGRPSNERSLLGRTPTDGSGARSRRERARGG